MQSHYDIEGLPGLLMNLSLGAIIVGYLVIAGQFAAMRWRLKRGQASDLRIADGDLSARATSALEQLVAIFIFCAGTGYLPRLFPFAEPVFVAVHLILAAVTWRYVIARNAVVLAMALARA